MTIKLMIVEMVIIFLMMSHHHWINDAMIIKLMIVEEGLNEYFPQLQEIVAPSFGNLPHYINPISYGL